MDVLILGSLVIRHNGRIVELHRPLERALVSLLVLEAGQVVSTDRLVDQLWPARPPELARHSLHVHVCRLRKALGDQVLLTRRPGYLLAVDLSRIDARRFESLVRDGRKTLRDDDAESSRDLFHQALGLWRGSPLPDLAGVPEGSVEISHLEEVYAAALEGLFEAELALGHYEEVIEGLTGLAAEYPFRERLWRHLMVALYRSGRQVDALLAYRQLEDLLDEAIGVDPGPELQHLREAIVLQQPELG